MQIEIRNRWTGAVLYAGKYSNVREALEAAVKSRADLRSADLRGADLARADLTGAFLRGAFLTDAVLTDAVLTGADLRGAVLTDADLRGAVLRGADLTGADLRGAVLRDADLRGAVLRDAKGLNPYLVQPLHILRDQPGAIRAYKVVTANGDGIYAANGGYKPINYLQADEFEVADANTDPNEDCGRGIHLATLDWCMKEWRPGYRILVMEFTAADIACIPHSGGGKFRVFRCRRVGEKDLAGLGLVKTEAEEG